jgi:hypothetical protein
MRQSVAAFAVLLIAACGLLGVSAAGATAASHSTAASQSTAPNLTTGSAYLVAPANLIDGHYYESFPGTADFGLTIDAALALAATGDEDAALRKIVAFLANDGADPSGGTVNEWTGIGTSEASGGAIGKEALLAEVVGRNPENFGGLNLITALDASVCPRASTGGNTSCPAAGSYLNDTSVFDQALGIMAQIRAGQLRQAAAPIAYLESLQSATGSFPSLIPPGGGPDVDSTALAVMALALAPGQRADGDVAAGLKWIAREQEHNGGFPSLAAESINSTGLAIQALTLRSDVYQAAISQADAFLAGQQNSNGGFNVDAGQPGSNLRASTQAVGGAVGTSFGTLSVSLNSPQAPVTSASSPAPTPQKTSHPARRHPRPAASSHRVTAHPARSAAQPATTRSPARPLAATQPGSAHPQGTPAALLALAIVSAGIIVAAVVLVAARSRPRRQRQRPAAPPSQPADQPARPADQPARPADPAPQPADPATLGGDPATHDQVSS